MSNGFFGSVEIPNTNRNIQTSPGRPGNIFMSFTPPENKSGNLSNQFKQHKIWTDHKMSLKNKKKEHNFLKLLKNQNVPFEFFNQFLSFQK